MSSESELEAGKPEPGAAARPGRRSFLRGMAGGVAGGVVAGGVAGGIGGYAYRGSPADPAAAANAAVVTGRLAAVPFHGKHQAGILPASSRATAVVSFGATAQSRAELADLFQTVTDRARFLTAGGTPPPVGIDGPPSDSGCSGRRWCPTG
jgi:deferrochelatase/peroxidase EfeB